MRSKVELFKRDWEQSIEVPMLKSRLDKLVKDGIVEGEEIDNILERLAELRQQSLKHYNLKESDL